MRLILSLQHIFAGNNRKRTKTRHTTGGARAPPSTASLLFEPGNSASERSALDIQDHAPSLLRTCVHVCVCNVDSHFVGVKPVSILNPARIPPSLVREDLPIPADRVVQEVFDEMLNGSGVPYHRLMAVIGSCVVCDQVMVLSKVLTHPCLGRTKEPGPHPSKHPRLPEDGRVLPTAGSRLKELEAMPAIIGTDQQGNNDRDAESSDKIIGKLAFISCLRATADICLCRFSDAQAKAQVQSPLAARLHQTAEETSYHEHRWPLPSDACIFTAGGDHRPHRFSRPYFDTCVYAADGDHRLHLCRDRRPHGFFRLCFDACV